MTIAAGFALLYDAFDEERGVRVAVAGRWDSQPAAQRGSFAGGM